MTQTAEGRSEELMRTPVPELPQLARDFVNHLATRGHLGPVYQPAFMAYAQCVEGLVCTGQKNLARDCDREWFEKRQAEDAIANGTIAEAEAAADEAEQVVAFVGDQVSEDALAEETLDDPLIPVMDWVNWILSSDKVRLDEYSERTGRLCLGILRNQILLHKHSVTLRVPTASAIDVGIHDALEETVVLARDLDDADAVAQALVAGFDKVDKAMES